jgi:hypothetical protein
MGKIIDMVKKLKRQKKVPVQTGRRAYLTRHLEYLRDELEKHADPDVRNRILLRIAAAEEELGD